MIKMDLNEVVKSLVECLLPHGSGDKLLAVALRIDTRLGISEAWLSQDIRRILEQQPQRYDEFCEPSERYHEVLLFRREMAYTQVWRRQATQERSLSLIGTYDEVANHDSTWIEGLAGVHELAIAKVGDLRARSTALLSPQHQFPLRAIQTTVFAQPPAFIQGLRLEGGKGQLILHPQ